jgi:hypothetical protein
MEDGNKPATSSMLHLYILHQFFRGVRCYHLTHSNYLNTIFTVNFKMTDQSDGNI